jgi:malate dehydrogenase
MTSFPIRTKADGSWEIVKGLKLNEYSKAMIKVSIDELTSERDTVKGLNII